MHLWDISRQYSFVPRDCWRWCWYLLVAFVVLWKREREREETSANDDDSVASYSADVVLGDPWCCSLPLSVLCWWCSIHLVISLYGESLDSVVMPHCGDLAAVFILWCWQQLLECDITHVRRSLLPLF